MLIFLDKRLSGGLDSWCFPESVLWAIPLLCLSACNNTSTTSDGANQDDGLRPVLVSDPMFPTDQGSGDVSLPVTGEINPGPAGDSNISLQGVISFPLTSALGDIWGVEGDHYRIDFTLTDGQFVIEPTLIGDVMHSLLMPVKASAVVRASLFSPGDVFGFNAYSHTSLQAMGHNLAGVAYFSDASLGLDFNGSGDVEADEYLNVIGGSMEFNGVLPDIELRMAWILSNGQLAEGDYTGLFDFTDRR